MNFCRFEIRPTNAQIKKTPSSTLESSDELQVDVATFCKAFPWHFVVDRNLDFVQLGSGFMQLFGGFLASQGKAVASYFEFRRPRSMTLSFEDIVKRANTPFVLVIRRPSGVKTFAAVVSDIFEYISVILQINCDILWGFNFYSLIYGDGLMIELISYISPSFLEF